MCLTIQEAREGVKDRKDGKRLVGSDLDDPR